MRKEIIRYGEELFSLMESEGEKIARTHHTELQTQNPQLKSFNYYIERYKLHIETEKLVKRNMEMTGLSEEVVRSPDMLAFERAIGIPPPSSIHASLEVYFMMQEEKV